MTSCHQFCFCKGNDMLVHCHLTERNVSISNACNAGTDLLCRSCMLSYSHSARKLFSSTVKPYNDINLPLKKISRSLDRIATYSFRPLGMVS
jgi:hypothetical protein